ncbi:MAG: hypothetical protein WC718_19460 [Phycisphaerales bacterium]
MAEVQGTKRTSVKKVDGELLQTGVYQATFADGTVVAVDGNALPDDIKRKLFLYGLKQKLDDSMALDAGSDLKDYIEELQATGDSLTSGQWTMRVAGEGVEGGLFARAYARHNAISLGDAKAKIAGLVERNLVANQTRFAGNKEALEKITERAVFNRIRDAALERDAGLNTTYQELKAAKGAKKRVGPVEMTVEL